MTRDHAPKGWRRLVDALVRRRLRRRLRHGDPYLYK
jgi:hypothetical protein